jgi:Uma2 family endonuclease
MVKVLENPVVCQIIDEAELERVYLELSERFGKHRVEIIDSRIVVRELPTINHGLVIYRLLCQLMSVAQEQGWSLLQEAKIFLAAQMDRYQPDLIAVPAKPLMWDPCHIYADSTLLVVEVVSPSSVQDDHVVKPKHCALAKVPLYLVIDTFQETARLLSHPTDHGYTTEVHVPLGYPLPLPSPWDLTLDTRKLIET